SVQRVRIIDLRRDAGREQVVAQSITRGGADRELVIDVIVAGGLTWRRYVRQEAGIRHQATIRRCVAAAALRPGLKVRKLYAQDRSLHRVEPAIDSQQLVFVLSAAAVDAQLFQPRGDGIVIGRDPAAVATPAKDLGREAAETADRADA